MNCQKRMTNLYRPQLWFSWVHSPKRLPLFTQISAYPLFVCNTVDHRKIRKVLKSFSIYKWISEISKCITNEDVVSRFQNSKTLRMCEVVPSQFVVHFFSTNRIVFSFCEGRGHIISVWEQFTSVTYTYTYAHAHVKEWFELSREKPHLTWEKEYTCVDRFASLTKSILNPGRPYILH